MVNRVQDPHPMSTQPKTQCSQILSQVNARVKAGGPYLDSTSFEVRRLICEAQKITGDAYQAIERFITLGAIHQICGNEAEMRHNFSCAAKLDRSPRTAAAYCGALINLGYISEAQKEFAKAARPELGWLTCIDSLGFLSMAMTPLNEFYADAQRLKIADLSAKHIEDAKRIQKILQEDDVTDQMVGQMLDDAGEILRARHLMRCAPCPSSYRICEDPYDDDSISIRWLVPVATDTASEMTFEYVDRFVRRFDKMPRCIGFSFLGTLC
jgi:hypothetical protein